MEAAELRLVGRADLVERQPGKVVVRDLKTGRVFTQEGEIMPHIGRQMRLYGVMAHRVWPDAEIQLVIDDGTEHEVSFSAAEDENTLTWLHGFLERLPAESTQLAEALATPGEACEACGFRHLCPAYRRAAPAFWQREMPALMPLDTWGEIADIAVRPNGLCEVTLTDAANRTVKVFGLRRARVEALAAGDLLWLFGLRTSDRRRGPEGWRHPRNFFEVADDDPFARAWSLETYGGEDRGGSIGGE